MNKVKQNWKSSLTNLLLMKRGYPAVLCNVSLRRNAYHFMMGFFMSCCKKQNSFSGWAQQIGMLTGESVSKQGLSDRMHSLCNSICQRVAPAGLLQQTAACFTSELFAGFGKVLLQDSTTLRLPQVLSHLFPGKWLGYSVYIATVDKDYWSTAQVASDYSVRWQIEIVFKSWKSGFHLQQILHEGCTNEHRVKVSIYLMLLFICLFMQKIYLCYKNMIEEQRGENIQFTKTNRFCL